jgi:tRNA pseudouridine13 synthase
MPGVGGVLKAEPEDFVVEEIPAYPPTGEGSHVLATVEKRGVSTFDAVRRIAQALGIHDSDIGTAGLKDKEAVARQQISLPPPVTLTAVLALDLPGLRVLSAGHHPHKLKTGHLRGNRFVVIVRGLDLPVPEAVDRTRAVLERLARPPGAPNFYGDQRFGVGGENPALGRALVVGERVRARPRPREARFLVSAFQSALFNRYLEERMKDGLYDRVIDGDILKKNDTGGLFVTTDPTTDQARLASGELTPTGPMFGSAMLAPPEGSAAAQREATLLAAEGLTIGDFRRVAQIGQGTRRPIAVQVAEAAVVPLPGAIELRFILPAGAYATVVCGEILKD